MAGTPKTKSAVVNPHTSIFDLPGGVLVFVKTLNSIHPLLMDLSS